MGKKELTAEEGIENKLWVEVRNERGQKLLIQYDAVYQMTESLKLELPLSNFLYLFQILSVHLFLR